MALNGEEFRQFSYFINNKYEPKKKNRFMLHIANIPQLDPTNPAALIGSPDVGTLSGLMIALDTANRPQYTVTAAEIRRYNERSFYAQEPTHSKEMSCEFFDYINDAVDGDVAASVSAAQVIYKWFTTIYNLDLGSMGYKDTYATDADLYLLDPHGRQIEQWHYTNFWPKDVNYNDLTMTGPEHCKISVVFQYDKAKMINAVGSDAAGAYSSSEYS